MTRRGKHSSISNSSGVVRTTHLGAIGSVLLRLGRLRVQSEVFLPARHVRSTLKMASLEISSRFLNQPLAQALACGRGQSRTVFGTRRKMWVRM